MNNEVKEKIEKILAINTMQLSELLSHKLGCKVEIEISTFGSSAILTSNELKNEGGLFKGIFSSVKIVTPPISVEKQARFELQIMTETPSCAVTHFMLPEKAVYDVETKKWSLV